MIDVDSLKTDARKLVRLTYFDDAGMFNAQQERFIVIGGCLVHGDNQLGLLRQALEIVRDKHIPSESREGFIFHATNIYSGTKFFSDRDVWPWQRRLEILKDLASIPGGLGLPILYGVVDRSRAYDPPEHFDHRDLEKGLFCGAFLAFEIQVELTMRKFFPSEITLLIGEDNDAIRSIAKTVHNIHRSKSEVERLYPEGADVLPFSAIQEGCHFSPKDERAALQIADFVTFFVKKRLVKDERSREICELLKKAIIVPIFD